MALEALLRGNRLVGAIAIILSRGQVWAMLVAIVVIVARSVWVVERAIAISITSTASTLPRLEGQRACKDYAQ